MYLKKKIIKITTELSYYLLSLQSPVFQGFYTCYFPHTSKFCWLTENRLQTGLRSSVVCGIERSQCCGSLDLALSV